MLFKDYIKSMDEGGSGSNAMATFAASLKRKSGVDINGINKNLVGYLMTLPTPLKDKVFITSGKDGKHSTNSKHYTGDALDLRIWDYYNTGDKNKAWGDDLYLHILNDEENRKKFGINIIENVNHGSAPHIHISTKGYNSPKWARNNSKIPNSQNVDLGLETTQPIDSPYIPQMIQTQVYQGFQIHEEEVEEQEQDLIKMALDRKIQEKKQVMDLLKTTTIQPLKFGVSQILEKGGKITPKMLFKLK